MPRLPDDFRPALGLSNGHAQTFFAALRRRPKVPPLTRRRFETPDGDFVDVDVLEGEVGAPTVLLLHGLEGSSASSYIAETLRLLAAKRWNAWALNFRGCSGEPNRVPASYCSGDTRDLAFLVERLPGPRFAIGFSLGASVLLNGLSRLKVPLDAAVAVSAPFHLEVSAKAIDARGGFGPVYLNHFLPSLKAKALAMAQRFPAHLDADVIRGVRTIRDFDHHVTARVFGYDSAEDYYARCSSAPLLASIEAPTLLITAEDDAIAPASSLPPGVERQAAVHLLRTRHGGHVGYVAGTPLTPGWWAERRAVEWLANEVRR
ncbi:MAG: alpha/beta fold hydrolase [Myxococcaceae bacterium]|nr:alpha/beta fold hydrolase [Myxococcaceae bacterium]